MLYPAEAPTCALSRLLLLAAGPAPARRTAVTRPSGSRASALRRGWCGEQPIGARGELGMEPARGRKRICSRSCGWAGSKPELEVRLWVVSAPRPLIP